MSGFMFAFTFLFFFSGRRSLKVEAPITKCPNPDVSMSICQVNTAILCPNLQKLTITGEQRPHLGAGCRYTG